MADTSHSCSSNSTQWPPSNTLDPLSNSKASVVREGDIEDAFIEKLRSLKYSVRPDIRDRAALEQNFREKFEALILHILMHLQRYPVIIIDQPEDDLDNETLYSHFIRQRVERKELTQFIFATHNPNIPILGDAEQAIVCRKEAERFSFDHGSIDDKDIQLRIVTVMEGGEDAFRRRKEIYQLWKSSN